MEVEECLLNYHEAWRILVRRTRKNIHISVKYLYMRVITNFNINIIIFVIILSILFVTDPSTWIADSVKCPLIYARWCENSLWLSSCIKNKVFKKGFYHSIAWKVFYQNIKTKTLVRFQADNIFANSNYRRILFHLFSAFDIVVNKIEPLFYTICSNPRIEFLTVG